jgi:hypothetical protein
MNLRRLSMIRLNDFCQQLRTKLHGLRRNLEKSMGELGGRCLDYPHTGGTVGGILDWFRREVQQLPSTFTESNKNIACFIVVGVLKMLAEVACEHLPELWRLVVSSDASLLHEIPKGIGKIVGKVVRRWWTQHGLPYCMQLLKEDNEVSFVPLPLF